MVDLTQLNNISALELNTSVANSSAVLQEGGQLLSTNIPYWLFPITIILFFTFIWLLYKKTDWGLNIVQTGVISSMLQIIISYIIIKMGWSVSVTPLMFWGVVWIILIISVFFIKKKS